MGQNRYDMELALPLGVSAWAAGITLAGVVALGLALWACVSVLGNAELSRGAKTMWILIIVLLPIFGSIVYFAVRSDW
jgi:Phospholipase_D-nuclease N-terminal